MLRSLRSLGARVAVLLLLLAVTAAVHAARAMRRLVGAQRAAGGASPKRLLIAGTFYNAGWFRAHIRPLAECRAIERIVVVCDEPLFEVHKVTYATPPVWLVRVCGRVLARAIWMGVAIRRARPDVLMGYHIMPNALLCLLYARLTGAAALYQMTGGPVQLSGGGNGSENVLLRELGKPSRWREALLFHLVRQFDGVVVRGQKAADFVRAHRLSRSCAVIPGSVDCGEFYPANGEPREYDLVCVGRLVPVKRHDRLLALVAALKALRPQVRVAIVGDGPLLESTRRRAVELGLADHVQFLGRREDVSAILRRARALVMTSENEGLSIALIEALACGLPVFAPHVGDLAELLSHGRNGAFIDVTDPAGAARVIASILDDPPRWTEMSAAARRTAVERVSVANVAHKWEAVFGNGVLDPAAKRAVVGPTSPQTRTSKACPWHPA